MSDHLAKAIRLKIPPVGIEGREHGYTEAELIGKAPCAEKAILAAYALISGAGTVLWCWSKSPGTGKTATAILALKKFSCDDGRRSAIFRMPYLSVCSWEERSTTLQVANELAFVVLDDFARFSWKREGSSDFIFSLIDRLYLRGSRILITANVPYASALGLAGSDYEAAFDRLREGGLSEVELGPKSVRK